MCPAGRECCPAQQLKCPDQYQHHTENKVHECTVSEDIVRHNVYMYIYTLVTHRVAVWSSRY